MAAKGSVTKTVTKKGNFIKVVWTLTSDASGDCDENGSAGATFFYTGAYGVLRSVQIQAGVAQPSDNYDIYVKDANSFDILHAQGVNLTGATKYRFCPKLAGNVTNEGADIVLFNDTIEVIGDEMGNAKNAVVTLVIERTPDTYI